eukprot:Colp12_sorted_trinity150504_noHs@32933
MAQVQLQSISLQEKTKVVLNVHMVGGPNKKVFKIETARGAPVNKIITAIFHNLKIDPNAYHAFALWLRSPDLELQLKPSHHPYIVKRQWLSLLEKFSRSSYKGHASVYFSRNAFLSKAQERKIRDPEAIKYLYYEAHNDVVSSIYPLEVKDAAYLAGLQLQIEYGDFERCQFLETRGFLNKDNMNEYVPVHLASRIKVAEWEQAILFHHKTFKGKTEAILHLLYLQYLWQFPYYGATWFAAEMVPKRTGFVMREVPNLVLRVGVNAEGVHIVDESSMTLMHTMWYGNFAWDVSAEADSFLIEHGDAANALDLELITPQAVLLDTMATSIVDMLAEQE